MDTNSEEMKFKKHLVAYVDVLGFKNIIASIKNNSNAQKIFLSSYLVDAFQEAKNIESTKNHSNIKLNIKIISDTFFFSIECDQDQQSSNFKEKLALLLGHMSVAVGNLQAFLSSKGIWTRGAICYGDLIIHKGNIVGPALIDSFLLESEAAIYPRVIVDTSIIKHFKNTAELIELVNKIKFSNWYSSKLFHLSEPTIEDSSFYDNLIFVDYFNSFIGSEEDFEKYENTIRALSDSVYNTPSIFKKHKWTIKYFIFKQRSLIASNSYPNLKIEKSLIKFTQNLLDM